MNSDPFLTSQDSFAELFRKEHDTLLIYARKILSLHGILINEEEAEDAVQETFLLAWKKFEDVQKSKNPGGWLMETLKNVIKHMIRSDQRAAKRLAAACAELDPNAHFPAPGADLELEGITSPENLTLLREFYLDGESYQTLCAKYGLKKSGLAMRLKRAKEDFKKNYEKIDEAREPSGESGNVLSVGGARK